MYSVMSFKCRSDTSLSSHTLVPSFANSTTTLLPTQPEKFIGLGIYTPKQATPAFLAPRPSLSSIRSHASMGKLPPSSPLPPLPAYLPCQYRKGSAMHKAVHPPQRPPRPERARSERTVRIVPPSPALSSANLGAHNKSCESLSSVYSRSISGERYNQAPAMLTAGDRSCSSDSTATVKESPLGAMRLASEPDVVVGAKRLESRSLDVDIDDAAMLQASLPLVQPVSKFGGVSGWSRLEGSTAQPEDQTAKRKRGGLSRSGLVVKKTRRTPALHGWKVLHE